MSSGILAAILVFEVLKNRTEKKKNEYKSQI